MAANGSLNYASQELGLKARGEARQSENRLIYSKIWSSVTPSLRRTLHVLPADTVVPAIFTSAVRNSNKINYTLTIAQKFWNAVEVRITVADHDRLSMIQNLSDSADHQPRYVRKSVEDELPVGAN